MALQGYIKLDLLQNGKIVDRVEKHNTVTLYPKKAINDGNFCSIMSPSKILPISQWFSGCLLTDNVNDPSAMMIAGDSNITAQAGNNAYEGTNTKRGSFNSTESGEITNGYRFVWDWLTSQGNGVIESVCLTRATIGAVEFKTDSALVDDAPANEQLSVNPLVMEDSRYMFSVIDYEREVTYSAVYNSGTITVYERQLNTKVLHLLGGSSGYRKQITHTISQAISNFNVATSCLSYEQSSGTLHLLTWTNEGNVLNDFELDLTNDTCTVSSHTYTGVKFSKIQGWDYVASIANAIMIRDGYYYALSNNWTKIAKCSTTVSADVTIVDNPVYSVYGSLNAPCNGPFVQLPNGDWYKCPTVWRRATINTIAIYNHNGVNSICKWVNKNADGDSALMSNVNITQYGTLLTLANNNNINVETCFPWVSTVANLDQAVNKRSDQSMKLTYEITEVTS